MAEKDKNSEALASSDFNICLCHFKTKNFVSRISYSEFYLAFPLQSVAKNLPSQPKEGAFLFNEIIEQNQTCHEKSLLNVKIKITTTFSL